MKGVRFYLEYATPQDKRKGADAGTVVAVWAEQGYFDRDARDEVQYCYEAVGGVFARPNSPVGGTSTTREYLATCCKRIPEARAREIHPALFAYLDSEP